MSPEQKLMHQTSVMFGAVFVALKQIDPQTAKHVLESAAKHCGDSEFGADIPEAVMDSVFGEKPQEQVPRSRYSGADLTVSLVA